MKKNFIFLSLIAFMLTGCQTTSNSAWESVKTAGRYVGKGFQALWGSDEDSRLISSEDEFVGPNDGDFIPLEDNDLDIKRSPTQKTTTQKRFVAKTEVPNLESFKDPSDKLNSIFRLIHFKTDDHVIYEKEDLVTVSRIANYLKKNPNAYLIVEGHCDERASAAYNMALGMRRANHIRVLLGKQGIDVNRVYTVSCGKEKPLKLGHTAHDFQINRRAQFKICQH